MRRASENFIPLPNNVKQDAPPRTPIRLEKKDPIIIGKGTIITNEDVFAAFNFQYYRNDESCFGQYRHYLQAYPENISQRTHAVLEKYPHLNKLMVRTAQFNEVVSIGSILLYERALALDKTSINRETTQNHQNWYLRTIEQCVEACARVEELARAFKESTQDEKFHHFIDDFQQELELLVADVVNLATGIAAHLTRINCAVFIGGLPVKIPENANFGNILSLFGEHSGRRLTVYDQYCSHLLSCLRANQKEFSEGKRRDVIYVPALVSASDAVEFAKQLNDFFNEMKLGLSTVKQDLQSGTFRLGETIDLLIRPDSNTNAQPRINFRGLERFNGFSLRIDKENTALAMDVGGYGYASLLKIVGAIARATQRGESIMDFSDFLYNGNHEGAKRVLYTPLNQNPEEIPKITQGDFMAYVAAFAMSLSQEMSMRSYFSAFSYHSRAFLATEPEHHTHFAANATTMYAIMEKLTDSSSN